MHNKSECHIVIPASHNFDSKAFPTARNGSKKLSAKVCTQQGIRRFRLQSSKTNMQRKCTISMRVKNSPKYIKAAKRIKKPFNTFL